MTYRYKYSHPAEWLESQIGQAIAAKDCMKLAQIAALLMQHVDSDDIQEDFESEMEADGYFWESGQDAEAKP